MSARLFALYQKIDGQWIRISNGAYPKPIAKWVFSFELSRAKQYKRHIELRAVSPQHHRGVA